MTSGTLDKDLFLDSILGNSYRSCSFLPTLAIIATPTSTKWYTHYTEHYQNRFYSVAAIRSWSSSQRYNLGSFSSIVSIIFVF